jgi:hypothetical protein
VQICGAGSAESCEEFDHARADFDKAVADGCNSTFADGMVGGQATRKAGVSESAAVCGASRI